MRLFLVSVNAKVVACHLASCCCIKLLQPALIACASTILSIYGWADEEKIVGKQSTYTDKVQ